MFHRLCGYYAWLSRKPSARAIEDRILTETIKTFHKASYETYGAPRIHADLRDAGIRIGRKRVARLMCEAGLRGVSRRRFVKTTKRDKRDRAANDLVERNFTATRPDQLWVADVTFVPTAAGFLFLAVVLDVFSRRILGWSAKSTMARNIVLEALGSALRLRQPSRGLLHHSDRGSQGRLNRSSQHQAKGGCIEYSEATVRQGRARSNGVSRAALGWAA